MDDTVPGSRTADGELLRCARVRSDERGALQTVDPFATDLLGWTPEELVGRRLGELAHPDDLARGLQTWARLAEVPAGTGCSTRLRLRHRDGHWIWTDVTSRRDAGTGDIVTDLVDAGIAVELGERADTLAQLLAHLSDVAGAGLFHAGGDGTLRHATRRLEELTGVEGAATLAAQLDAVAEGDRGRFRGALQQAARGETSVVELGAGAGGERRWRVHLRPLRDRAGNVTGVSGCLEDISARAGADRGGTETDPLTGCLTHEATLHALEDLIARHVPPGASGTPPAARRLGDGRGTAVIVVDLTGLAPLEALVEEHGQAALDELLRLVALRIVDTVRASDLVGRTGDAEFTALCSRVPGPTTARSIGRSILRQVAAPIVLQTSGPIAIGPGLGVAWASRPDMVAPELLQRAKDAAVASKLSDPPDPVLAEAAAPVSPPEPPR